MSASSDPAEPIPSDAEIARLLPGPGSILRRRASDPRAMAGAGGYALSLQIGHPTIAAGVRDHSTYATDPWGRAFRTADYIFLLAYGSPATVGHIARNLRRMHGSITGTDGHGRPYTALEPSAYAWVHATIGEAIVRGHDFMGTTFSSGDREEFWSEWLRLGRVVGVGPDALPPTWAGLQAYVATMIDEVLEDSDIVQELDAAAHRAVGGTPFRWLPEAAFGLAGRPAGNALRFLTVGMLPPALRERFHLTWTPRQERAFAAYCRASKASGPLLPRPVRQMGPLMLRLRRNEVGPFGEVNAVALAS